MATLRKELRLNARASDVWAAFEDVGAVHERLARGFVVDTKLQPGGRLVTFANGMVAFEAIITVDSEAQRLAYAIRGSPNLTHHNASFEVVADGAGARVVWVADLLPDALAETIGAMMDAGCVAMAKTLDG